MTFIGLFGNVVLLLIVFLNCRHLYKGRFPGHSHIRWNGIKVCAEGRWRCEARGQLVHERKLAMGKPCEQCRGVMGRARDLIL
jgi:hypothetical protein